jgi:hypothetical protein
MSFIMRQVQAMKPGEVKQAMVNPGTSCVAVPLMSKRKSSMDIRGRLRPKT